MAENRITQAAVMVETQPVSFNRITQAAVMVETQPVSFNRITQAAVMVEIGTESSAGSSTRIYGAALQ